MYAQVDKFRPPAKLPPATLLTSTPEKDEEGRMKRKASSVLLLHSHGGWETDH